MEFIIKKENLYSAHNYNSIEVVLSKAKGCYIWDINGKKYIDMMSAYSAVSHGHCNPKILKALKKQTNRLNICSRAFYSDKLAPFLEKICKISNFDKAIPMNTGSEAVETAIKAARLWGYKKKKIPQNKAEIIVAKGNFHGRTTTIVSFSTEKAYRDNFGPYTPGFKSVPINDIAALEKVINKNTCAFLVEPMQGEGGIIIPEKGWLKKVQKICKKNNILLILDEIQTGLGRTGKLFAYQHEINQPDGLILGKALGGGIMPISVFLANDKIMNLFKAGSHGSTFGGNPLACSVAMEALNILESEKLAENSSQMGKYLKDELSKIKSKAIKEVRGAGLWIGIELNPKIITGREFCLKLMEKGILTKETHETVVRLAPPLVINKKILDKTLKIIKKIFKDIDG